MTPEHEQGAELIRNAFAAARDGGSPDWRTMTTAVLKSRLLDATQRSFDEAKWGAENFRGFLSQFDDIVRVDPSQKPPLVTLLTEESARTGGEGSPREYVDLGPRRTIRSDLWEAILDFSSGFRYVWDGQRAVAVEPSEAAGSSLPSMPAMNRNEFNLWRAEFVERQSAENPQSAERLGAWLDAEQGLAALPPNFRVRWVIELKRRVLERLEEWFRAEGILPPDDVVISEVPASHGKPAPTALREFVLAAVREMSQPELEALQLPAAALMRSKS